MSSNNLDKLFKNKLENREFEFKDSYWGKMDATLEKNKDLFNNPSSKGSKFDTSFFRSKFGFFQVASIAVLSAGIYFLIENNQKQEITKTESNLNRIEDEPENSTVYSAIEKINSAKGDFDENSGPSTNEFVSNRNYYFFKSQKHLNTRPKSSIFDRQISDSNQGREKHSGIIPWIYTFNQENSKTQNSSGRITIFYCYF